MSVARVLVAEGETNARQALTSALSAAGHAAETATTAPEVFERLRRASYDLTFLDLDLPGGAGINLLREVKQLHPSMLVVLTSGVAPAETVIAAFRQGAYDYLLKPLLPDKVRELATRARSLRDKGEKRRRLSEELETERHRIRELKRRLESNDPFEAMVGTSTAMRDVMASLREVSRTDSTVLLTGETGTGKGLAARAIHEGSDRREGPFVEANCVVYSEGVLHSELFGHEKGAFTGADRQKRGRFERARGGTLFLDEIGDISPATQLLLLRVLQDQTFERVGGETTLETDVRLIAATNRDLQQAMQRGDFRSDLFFRLNVIPVHLPPLRERAEDIPALAQHFLRHFATRLGRRIEGFTPPAMDALCEHRWPGNIRELENLIERVVVMCRSPRIDVVDLPPVLARPAAAPRPAVVSGTLEDVERARIREALHEAGGNKKLAASRLGIHRSTLYAKIKKYRLTDAGEDAAETGADAPAPVRRVASR